MGEAKRKYLNHVMEFAVCKKIEAVCHKVGGYAVYDEGWSDGRIAHEIGPPCNANHVARLRLAIVGALRPVALPRGDAGIARLVELVEALVQWAGERPKAPFKAPAPPMPPPLGEPAE